jgi:hypothetical protein
MNYQKNREYPNTVGYIEADNGERFPDNIYTESSRATGTQQEVANMWARGDLPTHSVAGNRVKLYTSSGNFKGYQYREGYGLLKHYRHIQAIRTKSQLIIGDSSCYGKGWAHCSYPNDTKHYIDLTTIKANLKREDETIYDIEKVEDDRVVFSSGRYMDLDEYEVYDDDDPVPEPSPLGL